jgi:hypothetical protein
MSVSATTIACPLCRYQFPEFHVCPNACPLAGSCRMLCCPNCRYSFVADESTLFRWFVRAFRRILR